MIKFKFLAHHPVDHLAHIIIFSEFFEDASADTLLLESRWESSQISSTALGSQTNLNNSTLWMVSILTDFHLLHFF